MPVIFLMGPTASGKTDLALRLVNEFPCEIISVDSAMVYRGLDIGTAKPNPDILQTTPHHLINIVDPSEAYSAGQFHRDALLAIETILAKGRIPLLVGGTMLYFRVLQRGIAPLPPADPHLRQLLLNRAAQEGWENLHQELAEYDPLAAARINVNDAKRIQRALEVYLSTGKTISAWQINETSSSCYPIHALALLPSDRSILHQRIAERFKRMLALGFIEEVEQLYARGDLSPDLPAIRSVGYRQAWSFLASEITYAEMVEQAIAATRQLAKRQLTWLRSWPNLFSIELAHTEDGYQAAHAWLKRVLSA